MPAAIALAATLGLTSSPHCAAMCGPLVCASCVRPQGRARWGVAAYWAGRSVSYALLGATAGLVGHAVAPAAWVPKLQTATQGFVAASLILTGLRWLRSATADHGQVAPRAPARPRASALFSLWARRAPKTSFGLGLVTALFPCGALAGAVLVAASAGTAAAGALAMSAFALASAPALLVLASIGGRAGAWIETRSAPLRAAAGVLTVGIGVLAGALLTASPRAARASGEAGTAMPADCPLHHGGR